MSRVPKDEVNSIRTPLVLPCGQSFPNRLFKSAMTEGLADPSNQLPNEKHFRLYDRWAKGGCGVLVTGNVMIDRRYCEAPGNVALEAIDEKPERLALYAQWADSIQKNGSIALMQISHPGRQCPMSVTWSPIAPSAIPIALKGLPPALSPACKPRAMTMDEINEVKNRFVTTALLAEKAGWNGVQIHGAHGYLLSQFLSGRANIRGDVYGGSSENRRRLLLEVVEAVKSSVSKNFIVGIKLNSADFMHGGLTEADSIEIIDELQKLKVDFVEISGGTYESSNALLRKGESSKPVRESTLKREAYYLEFGIRVRSRCTQTPLIVTGGWRNGLSMHRALLNGELDVIGFARPLCIDPDFSKRLVEADFSSGDEAPIVTVPPYSLDLTVGIESMRPTVESLLENFYHQEQMLEILRGKTPRVDMWKSNLSRLFHVVHYALPLYIYNPKRYPIRALFYGLGTAALAGFGYLKWKK